MAKAKETTFNTKKVKTTVNGCQGTTYPFVCDYVYRSLEQTASLGSTVEERQQAIKRGGLDHPDHDRPGDPEDRAEAGQHGRRRRPIR